MAIAESPVGPPQNLEAEESVLGAILLSDKTLYALVIDTGLKADDFYREQHRIVYQAILDLYNDGKRVDVVTLTDHLKQSGRLEEAGGPAAIQGLTGTVPMAGNAPQYAQIVKESAILRRLLTTTYDIQSSILTHQAAPRELVEQAERSVLEVAHDDRQKEFERVGDILSHELDKLHDLSRGKTAITGTRSGFEDLDAVTAGFQSGNLVVIAARPSMGKSALVANIAENAAIRDGKAVALFSLEMSETELAQRFIASQASIRGEELRKGRVPEQRWPKILDACTRLSEAPLYIDDSSDVGMLEVRAKARRLHAQHQPEGLGLVIIDYLQLMRADHRIENRVEQVGQMSRGLKVLARELDVPVIALSQLNRGVEGRTDKRPILSDLRESGSIEQDSDVVIFIYRDDYYHEDSEEPDVAELNIAKHRNGPLGRVKLVFRHEFPRFMNYQPEERVAA